MTEKSEKIRDEKHFLITTCPYCQNIIYPGDIQCPNCGKYLDGKERVEFRCQCGSLLCKITLEQIEIKCRRCKRIMAIPITKPKELFYELQERQNIKQRNKNVKKFNPERLRNKNSLKNKS